MPTPDLTTDIDLGQQIFEDIPSELRPVWGGLILSCFNLSVKNIPPPVKELFPIIDSPKNWRQAHAQFDHIRSFNLDNPTFQPQNYLILAEQVAKITYNASRGPTPFDFNSGWYIPSLAMKTALFFEDDGLEEEVGENILIFNHNKIFQKNIPAAQDFFLYKKIDHLLWRDWDPIGVNDYHGPRDEYRSYVPEILRLKKSGADQNKIAEHLLRLETETMGMAGTLEGCLVVADKIIKA